jgi:hypothetical protein
MSDGQRNPNLIPAVGFRVLTCTINDEDDSAAFTDSPLIGWLQTNDPHGDPVDPIFLDDGGDPVVGSEMEAYQVAYRVFSSELNDAQRFALRASLEKFARLLMETRESVA